MGQLTRYRFKPGDSSLAYCTSPSGSGAGPETRSPSAMPARTGQFESAQQRCTQSLPSAAAFHIGRIDGQQVVHAVFNFPRNRPAPGCAASRLAPASEKTLRARAAPCFESCPARNPPLPIGIGTLYATALPLASAYLMRGRAIIASCGKDRKEVSPCTSGDQACSAEQKGVSRLLSWRKPTNAPRFKGTEVKSMRQGRVNLKESFAMVRGWQP